MNELPPSGPRSPASMPDTGVVASPCYGVPRGLELSLAASVLLGRRRRFSVDAKRLVGAFRPPPRVEHAERIPPEGPFLAVTNHYYAPGYRVWWGIALISATLAERRPEARETVWMLANRWTYPDALRSHLVTPLTYVVFTRLARVYGFISTPPMPRQERYTEEGAQSVRRLLARLDPAVVAERPAIGIAPEGRDSPDGSLVEPQEGTGRLLLHIAKRGLPLLPIGVCEVDGVLTARCGPSFSLENHPGLGKNEQDRAASAQAMVEIGKLLPHELWGAYRAQIEQCLSRAEAPPAPARAARS